MKIFLFIGVPLRFPNSVVPELLFPVPRLALGQVMSAAPRTLLTTLRSAVRSRAPAQSPRPWTASTSVQTRSLASAVEAQRPNKGLTREEVQQIYDSPLMELIYRAVSPAKVEGA